MIRLFTKKDADQCANIINRCHKTMPELKGKELTYLLKKYTPDYLKEEFKKHYVLVFEEGDRIIALGALIKNSNEIRWVYVDPDMQGKGCGKSLMEELEKEAKKRNYEKAIVESYFGAVSFYEKLEYKKINEGFKKYGNAVFYFVNMEKYL